MEPVLEEGKDAVGYEGMYKMTVSGRIYSYKHKKYKNSKGDEYGYHTVRLSNKGVAQNYNLFELWQDTFKEELASGSMRVSEFKGAVKKKK